MLVHKLVCSHGTAPSVWGIWILGNSVWGVTDDDASGVPFLPSRFTGVRCLISHMLRGDGQPGFFSFLMSRG